MIGMLISATITPDFDSEVKVRYGEKVISLAVKKGKATKVTTALFN